MPAQTAPISADALYRTGYEAYNRGDLAAAHARFAKLVMLAPKVSAAHAAYGLVLLAQGSPKSALHELETAHQLDPHAPATLLALGEAHVQLGQFAEAARAFGEAAAAGATPDLRESRSYATALAATGQRAEAVAVLQAVLAAPNGAAAAAAPAADRSDRLDRAGAEDALGSLLAQGGDYASARQHFSAALELAPENASARLHLGSALLALGQTTAAIPELRRAVELAPASAEPLAELGRALSQSGDDAEAIPVLEHAVALASAPATHEDAEYALALALQAGGKLGRALPLLASYTAAHPHDSAALTNYALALVQTGDAKHAVTAYAAALAAGPDNATLREDYGVAYLQQSDLDHAIEQFRAGLGLEPENPHLHYDLGLAFKLKDDLPAAVPELQRAEALDPTLPDPPYTLGVLQMQRGEFAAASAELEKAVALRPENGDAWAVLGNVYKEDAQPEKAAEALRQAIALEPQQPSLHISLAVLLSQAGDRDGAAAERKQAADLSRAAVSRQHADFALRSGRALLDRNQPKEAEAQLRTALAATPDDPAVHATLAEALAREGQAADAAVERQKAEALRGKAQP